MSISTKNINLTQEVLKRLGNVLVPKPINNSSRELEKYENQGNLVQYYLNENFDALYGKHNLDVLDEALVKEDELESIKSKFVGEIDIERDKNNIVISSIFDKNIYEICVNVDDENDIRSLECVNKLNKSTVFSITLDERKVVNSLKIEKLDDMDIYEYAYDDVDKTFSYRHSKYNDVCRGILFDGTLEYFNVRFKSDLEAFNYTRTVPCMETPTLKERLINFFKNNNNSMVTIRTNQELFNLANYVDKIFAYLKDDEVKCQEKNENKDEVILKK